MGSVVKRETQVYETETLTSAHDSDIVRLESQIDEWNLALRQNILVMYFMKYVKSHCSVVCMYCKS